MEAERRRSRLRRIARLLVLYARMDLLWVTRGLGTAAAWYLSDAIVSIGLVTTTYLVAERFDGIGSWSKHEVLFMLAYSMLARGLVEMMFGQNVSFISRRIGRGQLDHVLLQPQPMWLTLLVEGFTPVSGSGMVLAAAVLGGYSVAQLGLVVTPAWLLLAIVNVAASALVILAFCYAWGSLAFWAPRAAEEINSSSTRLIDQLRVFPLDGLGGPLIVGLMSFVPVAFVAWLPSRALLAAPAASLSPAAPFSPAAPISPAMLATPAASLGFAALAFSIFLRGLHHYGKTGSSRYLAYGHRR